MAPRWHLTKDGGEVPRERRPEPPARRDPGVEALLAMQAGAGNQAVARRLAERAAAPLPHRAKLEAAFGTDLGDIRVDGGPEAAGALAREQAHAAALPERILFDRPDPDLGTVAHEVTHVLQQRRGGASTDGAEREAGVLGRAVSRGERVAVNEGALAGVPQFLKWRNGTDKPPIKHDHGFLDDGKGNLDLTKMREATAGDYLEKAKWQSKLAIAQMMMPGLADATRAYEHFLNATGSDLTVNYEKFVDEDKSGGTLLASAVEDAKDGAREKDNEWMNAHPVSPVADHSFDMASDPIPVGSDSRYPYPATENWQKAIGAHVCWISAHVEVKVNNETQERTMAVNLTVHMEDRYNFNPGAKDIATGTPDSANGIFELTGLGKEFMQYGTVSRVVTLTEPVLSPVGTPTPSTVGGEPRGGAPRSSRHDREGDGPD